MSKIDFKFHPEIENKNFFKKLYSKKEFYKYQYENEKRSMENICPQTSLSREFKLSPHQEYLKNFISPHTPYNGILIYHMTGTGKTCSAIQIAEGFKETLSNYGKKILVISSESIKKNFKKGIFNPSKLSLKKKKDDIVQCTGLTYELGPEFSHLTKEQKNLRIDKTIKKYYKFYPYRSFANHVKKILKWDGELENLTDDQKERINQIYSKRVIIVDEVHNIRKGGSVKEKDTYKILEAIIRYSSNLRLVFMSATPMYDQPKEIIDLLNLLLLNDNREPLVVSDIMDSEGNLRPKGEQILLEYSKGYVSFLRGENPSTFPLRLFPKEAKVPQIKYNIYGKELDDDDKLEFSKCIVCPMKGLQLKTYEDIMKERLNSINNNNNNNEQTKSGSFQNFIQLSNIVYPTNHDTAVWGKKGFDITDSGEGGFYKIDKVIGKKKLNQFAYQKHVLFKEKDNKVVPFLDETLLENYSDKFKKCLDILKTSKGLSIISSMFISAGILPFALMLEQNGFRRYAVEGEAKDLLRSEHKRQPICYLCGKEARANKEHYDKTLKGYHEYHTARYVMVSGSADPEMDIVKIDTYKAVEKFSSYENRYGKEVKVFLGSSVIKEGLDFANIRQLFILDPWHNISDHEQKIGRAVRFCSHVRLLPEERNVEIFQMDSSLSGSKDEKLKETESIDERRYRKAELKDKKIKYIRNILKRSSIDCVNYKKRNLFKGLKNVKQVTSSGNEVLINLEDKPFSVECDYLENCDYTCLWEPEGNEKINSNTYDLMFDQTDIQKATKAINELFKKDIVFEINKIRNFVKSKYPDLEDRFIYKALDLLLENKKNYITDKFNRLGYLIFRGDYYIFQPLDLPYEKIPIYYRKQILKKKVKRIPILEKNLNDNNDDNNNNNNNNTNKNELVNDIINQIENNFILFDNLKQYDNKNLVSFKKSICGLVIDKLDAKLKLIFFKKVISLYLLNNSKKDDIISVIIFYMDPYLIKYGREITEDDSLNTKDKIYGFRLNNEYYHFKMNTKQWSKSPKQVIYRIETYLKLIKDKKIKKDDKKKKNNIIGVLTKNKKNVNIFQIIDYSKLSNILTQDKKLSKRGELTGRTCSTIPIQNIKDIIKNLGLKKHEKKKSRNYMCNEIELFLRINEYNNKDNKIWIINKNL